MKTAFGREARAGVIPARTLGWMAAAVLALTHVVCAGCGDGNPGSSDGSDGTPTCTRDDSEDSDSAVLLEPPVTQTGYLCPVQDQDWYEVTLDGDDALLRVSLSVSTTRSPVEVTYAVWREDGAGALETVGSPNPSDIGGALDDVYHLDPGTYFIGVRDQGDNAQDYRNEYSMTVTTSGESDDNEPNDDSSEATDMTSGQELPGYISYAGDEDWFAITVTANQVLHVGLDMELCNLEPRVRILDGTGTVLVEEKNLAGRTIRTEIDLVRLPPSPGIYYVVVSDDDNTDADPDIPYAVRIDALNDMDDNEPNDHPTDPDITMPAVTCGANWSSCSEAVGTIAAAGDVDWFELPTTGLRGQILEAEMEFDTSALSDADKWTFQRDVQAAIAFVRTHAGSPCTQDTACRSLAGIPCYDKWDCAGYGQECVDGFCAGATVCITGYCGANQIFRFYPSSTATSGTPPPNEVLLSTTILENGPIFLRVSDSLSDAGDPTVPYTLRARLRSDPDTNETADPYIMDIVEEDDYPLDAILDAATTGIPIHDCTAGIDCCSDSTWTDGAISYDYDVDAYQFTTHPCPGVDCRLNLHIESLSGEVPLYNTQFLNGDGRLFFGWKLPGSCSDTFGGTDGRCFYASLKHTDSGGYFMIIRDDKEDSRDWDPDQRYRFCVEKVATSFSNPPCDDQYLAEDGGSWAAPGNQRDLCEP